MQMITRSDSPLNSSSARATRQRAIVAGVAVMLGGTFAGIVSAQEVPSISLATPGKAISPNGAEKGDTVATTKTRMLINEAGMSVPMPMPGTVAVMPRARPTITIDFRDVGVADLISMIAQQGNIGILITDDVTKKIKNIALTNKTPEEAIKMVAKHAGYAWSKIDENTYAISAKAEGLPNPEKIQEDDGKPEVPKGGQTFNVPNQPENNFDPPVASIRSAPTTNVPELFDIRANDAVESDYAYIRARNVAPHILAYWIDPRHNPEPAEFTQGRELAELLNGPYIARRAIDPNATAIENGYATSSGNSNRWSGAASAAASGYGGAYGQFGGVQTRVSGQANPNFPNNNFPNNNQNFPNNGFPNNNQNFPNNGFPNNNQNFPNGFPNNNAGGGSNLFKLPEGIESLVSIDAQSSLLVRGTPTGIAELERVIAFLDRPLRQVEIEAQFVSLSTGSTKTFGIDFTSANGPFSVASTGRATGSGLIIGYARNNFRALLGALEAKNQARRVTAPRVTAINNTLATIGTLVSTPFRTTTTTTPFTGQVITNTQQNYVTTFTGLSVTPTINGDDTVTFRLKPQLSAQDPSADGQAPTITTQNVDTLVNVKDGDTIVLGGLRTKVLTNTESGVPILSKIPVLGKLFRGTSKVAADGDLIVFVTARIVRRAEEPVPGV